MILGLVGVVMYVIWYSLLINYVIWGRTENGNSVFLWHEKSKNKS